MSNQLQVSGEAKIRAIQGPVVANSGVITALDGDASQYVRGDGTLADFPTSTGGGSSVSYYLNTSISQGTIGGVAYKQLSKTPIAGAGTDVTTSANGYIASYITDANDPALLEVPAGNFNCEFYFSVNSNAHNPYVYAEVYKYDGTTFTLLGSNVSIPQYLSNGTTLSPYYFAIAVATSVLTVTDRIAIRIYVNVDGRTVTLHTENNHLCQVVTTFSKGLISLNNLTRQNQFFGTGTSGTDFAISSSVATHTFNLPVASASNTGKLSSTDWSTFNGKVPYTGATANLDLGLFSISGSTLFLNGTPTTIPGYLYLKKIGNAAYINYADYGGITAYSNNFTFISDVNGTDMKKAIFDLASLTNNTARTFTLPDLSGTLALLEGTQTFTGLKRFDLGLLLIEGATPSAVGYTGLTGDANGLVITKRVGSTGYTNLLSFTSATSNTYTFPNASGTIALLESNQTFTGGNIFSSNISVSGITIGKGRQAGTGLYNIALGFTSLQGNTTGESNVSIGIGSLYTNTTGNHNLSFGYQALFANTTGGSNIAMGLNTLGDNTTGNNNIGIGIQALDKSTTADGNIAVGYAALNANTTGAYNTGIGYAAGSVITTGSYNTIVGRYNGTATMDNNIVLADGAGNIRYQWNGTNNVFGNPISGTSAVFSSSLVASVLQSTSGIILSTTIQVTPSSPSIAICGTPTGLEYRTSANVNSLIFQAANYTYTFPAATGTIALLSGTQTFTGATTFSSNITVNSIQVGSAGNTTNIKLGGSTFGAITTGSNNIAIGTSALTSITTSNANIGIGNSALASVVDGAFNTAIGFGIGGSITSGSNNALFGYGAGSAITTGNYNTILGAYAGTAGMSNNIVLADGAGTIRYQWNGTNNVFTGAATFSSSVTATQGKFSGSRPQGIFTENGTSGLYLRDATGTGYKSWSIGTNDIVVGFAITPSTAVGGTTFTTPSFVINELGNVGLGKTPRTTGGITLDVAGGIQSTNDSGNQSYINFGQFSDPSLSYTYLQGDARSTGFLKFFTNDTERMRIRSDGNTTIGFTDGYSNIRLNVRGVDSTSSNFVIHAETSTGTNFYVRNDGFINTGLKSTSPYNNSTTGRSMVIESGGGLGYLVSTRESKANIESISNVDFINQLNPVQFNYRKKDNITNEFTDELYDNITYGFIADEVEKVNKELVFYKEDGSLAGVEYNNMIAILTKAVQELEARIKQLENK